MVACRKDHRPGLSKQTTKSVRDPKFESTLSKTRSDRVESNCCIRERSGKTPSSGMNLWVCQYTYTGSNHFHVILKQRWQGLQIGSWDKIGCALAVPNVRSQLQLQLLRWPWASTRGHTWPQPHVHQYVGGTELCHVVKEWTMTFCSLAAMNAVHFLELYMHAEHMLGIL